MDQDRRDLRRVEIAGFRYRCPFDRDVDDLDALRDGRGVPRGHEVEEAAYRRKPAVARANRAMTFMFGMTEERADLAGGEVGQGDPRDLLALSIDDEPQEQPPGIAVGPDSVSRCVALFDEPAIFSKAHVNRRRPQSPLLWACAIAGLNDYRIPTNAFE